MGLCRYYDKTLPVVREVIKSRHTDSIPVFLAECIFFFIAVSLIKISGWNDCSAAFDAVPEQFFLQYGFCLGIDDYAGAVDSGIAPLDPCQFYAICTPYHYD